MPKGVIDLRKPSFERGREERSLAARPMRGSEVKPGASRVPTAQATHGFDLKWSCHEHEYRVRGPYWFLYPLVAATAAIVFGIATRNYLFIAFVLMSFILLSYYAKRPPRVVTYAIEKRGVWIDEKFIDYGKIKSFWIFTHALMAPELLLETESPLNPFLHIRLETIGPDMVRSVIARYLPEKERKDALSDQITRIIGF